MTFTCTISSVAHRWSVPSLGIILSLLPGDQGRVFSDPPFQFSVTEVRTGSSITSTATVTATSDLNGTLVLCQDGIGILPDQNSTITLRGMGIMYLYLDKQSMDNWIMGIFVLCMPVIYHTSNPHECMGVNGEALQLHAVYKKPYFLLQVT